jgi:hypothetical protein
VNRSPISRRLHGQVLARLLEGGYLAEMFLGVTGEFAGRTRYYFLDAILGVSRGINPSDEYRRLDQAVAETTKDPEDPSPLPEIFWTAEFGGEGAY